jgi:hypothetical protein
MKEVALQPQEPLAHSRLPKHLQAVALATPLVKIEVSQTTHLELTPEPTMMELESLQAQPVFSFQTNSALGQLQEETPNFEMAKMFELQVTQL